MACGVWRPRNRGGGWAPYRCRITLADGTRRVVSTRQKEIGAARAAAQRLQREAAAGHDPTQPRPSLRLEDVVSAWLASRDVSGGHERRGCAVDTRAYYRRKADRVLEVLGKSRDVNKLRLDDIEGYIRTRRDAVSDSTIGKELVVLRAALRRARRQGLRVDPDAIWPEFAVEYTPRTRWLTPPELEQLCAQLRSDRARLVRFLVFCGARDREWQRLEHGHVDLRLQRLTLPGKKTVKSWRVLPLDEHPELRTILRQALLARGGGKLFRRWTNMVRDLGRACARAKIARCSANDLRRTFATWLRIADVPLDRIARLLGHTSSRLVEKVYGQLRPEDLARELGKAFGARVQPYVGSEYREADAGELEQLELVGVA